MGSRQQLSLQPTASTGLLDRAQTSAHSVNAHDYQVQCDISQLPIGKTVAYADYGMESFAKCNLLCSAQCRFVYVTPFMCICISLHPSAVNFFV